MIHRRRILIDTDPGIDDAMALFYALASPEFDVVAVTTIFGNTDVELATTNALRLLDIAGRPDIPVAKGAARPLAMDYRGAADFVHGRDSQGDVFLPPSPRTPIDASAAQCIIDTVLASPGDVTVVLLGPFTNMALAMLMRPDLTQYVAEIVVMGGAAFTSGNASPASEANILNDPEAADLVFGAQCPITMAGLDVTHKVMMEAADLDRIGSIDSAQGRHLAAILPYYLAFYRSRNDVDGIFVHDSTTITYLLAPDLFSWTELPIRVDIGHSVCRGRTLAAYCDSDEEGPWKGRRSVRILTGVDSRAAIDLEYSRLKQA